MNIFILDHDTTKAAEYHNDKHCVKMILESTQLLSNAFWLNGSVGCYKLTHKNHPATRWVSTSSSNFNWLCSLAIALCKEYTHRYGKVHKCEAKILTMVEMSSGLNFSQTSQTPFVQCMPDCYKSNDAVISYREYYLKEKRGFAKWTNRPIPYWWKFD